MSATTEAFFLGWAAGWVSVAVMLSVFSVFLAPYVQRRRK